MQRDDFRDDLPVTRGQWRLIAEHLCRLAGEPVPASRVGALELVLRLETHGDARSPVPWSRSRSSGP
jgi:hypothetical protein